MPQQNTISTTTAVREDDTQSHIEDTPLYTAIRDGRMVQVTWNDLTEDERRAAYIQTFQIYS